MTDVRKIHVDWYAQHPPRFNGGPQLACQGDHLSNMVIFDHAPELPNYYLLVEMKTDDAGPVVTLPEIRLEGPYWVIPNYYTQICQKITYQVCCKTESGDFEHHSAKFEGTILPVIKHNGEPIDQSPMFDPYIDILDKRMSKLILDADVKEVDSELKSDSGNPVQNRVIKAKIDEIDENAIALNGRLDDLGIPYSIREAIYNLFDAAGYTETTNVSASLAVLKAWAEETTSLSINQSTLSLVSRRATAQLTATVVPSSNTVTWTSSDTSVATVSSAGLVTAVGIGTAVITATSGNISKTCLVTASWTIQNTTASILQSGAYYFDVGNTHAVREAENAAITVLYDLDAATTALSLSGVIVNDGIMTSTSIGTLRVYKDGESVTYWGMYGRWAKEPADSYTEYSKATTVSEFNQISFTVDSRYLDDSYMYDGVTGQVYFAGVNTPYYGMSNISEAS